MPGDCKAAIRPNLDLGFLSKSHQVFNVPGVAQTSTDQLGVCPHAGLYIVKPGTHGPLGGRGRAGGGRGR